MNKLWKLIAIILIALSTSSCTQRNSDTDLISIEINSETNSLEKNTGIMEDVWSDPFEQSCAYKLILDEDGMETDSDLLEGKHLSINHIQIGSEVDEVLKAFELEDNFASYDYEYDIDHDGTTKINNGLYNGTIPDFKQENILDYSLQFYYILEDDHYTLLNLKEEKIEDYHDYYHIVIDFNGNKNAYENCEEGTVMMISIFYYHQ